MVKIPLMEVVKETVLGAWKPETPGIKAKTGELGSL